MDKIKLVSIMVTIFVNGMNCDTDCDCKTIKELQEFMQKEIFQNKFEISKMNSRLRRLESSKRHLTGIDNKASSHEPDGQSTPGDQNRCNQDLVRIYSLEDKVTSIASLLKIKDVISTNVSQATKRSGLLDQIETKLSILFLQVQDLKKSDADKHVLGTIVKKTLSTEKRNQKKFMTLLKNSVENVNNSIRTETESLMEKYNETFIKRCDKSIEAMKKVTMNINQTINEEINIITESLHDLTEELSDANRKVSSLLDGDWSSWENWGPCSASCGGGIQSRLRTCSNPRPSLLGRYCDGSPDERRTCNKRRRCASGYYGTRFIFGYMKNFKSASSPTFYVICEQGEAIVRISIPDLSIDEEVSTVGGVLKKQYTNRLSSSMSGNTSSKAVLVTTNIPVVIFSGHFAAGSSDGSFILPESSLGSTYLISGHPSTAFGLDEILVVGTTDTQVTFTSSSGFSDTFALKRMQTYYKMASDMSGTMISASAPLFVLSGHSCANIPDNSIQYCDYIEAAMPPINALGFIHVISFMKPRTHFTVSIVAPFNQTSVTITDKIGNQIEILSLNERNTAFRTFKGSTTISIITDLPVLVTIYGHGSKLVFGDPSMMIVPDITFFGHVYDFFVPKGFQSSLQIIISDIYPVSGLLLNGKPISPTETIVTTVPKHGTFTVVYADVVSGKYRVTHSLTNAASFGAWLYGRTHKEEYATNLGINV